MFCCRVGCTEKVPGSGVAGVFKATVLQKGVKIVGEEFTTVTLYTFNDNVRAGLN